MNISNYQRAVQGILTVPDTVGQPGIGGWRGISHRFPINPWSEMSTYPLSLTVVCVVISPDFQLNAIVEWLEVNLESAATDRKQVP
jgi:hypothetical protein